MTNRPGPLGQRIAAELRAELGRQNHSRRWLAEQIGQPHNTVARWIGGETAPSLDALDAMCRALGVSVADLLIAVERHGGYEVTPLPRSRRSAEGATAAEITRTNKGITENSLCYGAGIPAPRSVTKLGALVSVGQ